MPSPSATDKHAFQQFALDLLGTNVSWRESVVSEALAHRPHAEASLRNRFDKMLKQSVRASGFRDASKAPVTASLVAPLARACLGSPAVLHSVLEMWAGGQGDLCADVKKWREEQENGIADDNQATPPQQKTTLVPGWDAAPEEAQVDAFATDHPEYDRLKTALAWRLFVKAGEDERTGKAEDADATPAAPKAVDALITESKGESDNGIATNLLWEPWLAVWRDLPAERPEWRHIGEFLQQLTTLADEKRLEAEERLRNINASRVREELRNFLGTVAAEYVAAFHYLGIDASVIAAWDVDAIASEVLSDRVTLAQSVAGAAADLEDTLSLADATRAERSEKNRRLEATADALEQAFNPLVSLFPFVSEENRAAPEATETLSPSPAVKSVTHAPEALVPSPTDATQPDVSVSTPVSPKESTEDNAQNAQEERIVAAVAAVAAVAVTDFDQRFFVDAPRVDKATDEAEEIIYFATPLAPAPDEVEIVETLPAEIAAPVVVTVPEALLKPISSAGLAQSTATERPTDEDDEAMAGQEAAAQAARRLQQQATPQNEARFLWALLRENDLSGAYWVSRSYAEREWNPFPVAPEVIAVMQGASVLLSDTDTLVPDLLDIVSGSEPPPAAS